MRFLMDLIAMIGLSDPGLWKEAVTFPSVPDTHQSICCLVRREGQGLEWNIVFILPTNLAGSSLGWFRLTECSIWTTVLAGTERSASNLPPLLWRDCAFGGTQVPHLTCQKTVPCANSLSKLHEVFLLFAVWWYLLSLMLRMMVVGRLWSGPLSTSMWTWWSCCCPKALTSISGTMWVFHGGLETLRTQPLRRLEGLGHWATFSV